jgi:hypothetical protein
MHFECTLKFHTILNAKSTSTFPLLSTLVTIYLEGLADVVAFYWLTSMVDNNP